MTDYFQTAMNAFINGDTKEAKRICKVILKHQPTAHPALHLLAMTEKRRRNYKLAIRTFNKALQLAPSTAMYWNNLGETYREMGSHGKAIECYQKAIRYRPEYAEAYSNWGAALTTKGDFSEAEQKLLRAIEINPVLVNAIYNLSVLYIDTSSPEVARQTIERVLSIDPNNTDSLVNLGYLDQEANRFEQARAHYLRAIAINPSHFKAQLNLGNLYYDEKHYGEATKHYRKATEINPQDFDAWFGLSRAHMKNIYFQDACDAFKQATTINRNSGEALLGLADATLGIGDQNGAMRILERYRKTIGVDAKLHMQLAETHLNGGELIKAEAEARLCLALKPENVAAYDIIIKTKRFRKGDDDLLDMLKIYDHAELKVDDRLVLTFALAEVMEMTGDYDAAFEYLEKGNRCKRESADHGMNDQITELTRKLESVFTREYFETHNKHGCEDGAPIFIAGLPRTGKTVAETLLCRHPLITAAGELKQFIDTVITLLKDKKLGSFPDGVLALSELQFESVGKKYIGELRKRFKTAQRIVNTHPGNAFQVGMINLCLPQAKVIWIDRDMRDACFQMYRKNFARGHEYSYELGLLGEYAVLFNNLMEYWNQLLPGFIYKVEFENLIGDAETQMRGLLNFCGLDWDDACLEKVYTGQEETTVFTSLPTSENSIGVWKPYERYLSPLFDALERKYN